MYDTTIPCIENPSNALSTLKRVIAERDILLLAVQACVDNTVSDVRIFCEDYSMDMSLGAPTKMEILTHAMEWIRAQRIKASPRSAPVEQALPVSDIPLGLSDP